MLEDESLFIYVEGMPDLLVFGEEWVLFECFKVALSTAGFLGFIPDEIGFIQGVIILDVLGILLFHFSFFNFLIFFALIFIYVLALFCQLFPPFLKVFIPS